MNVRKTNSDQVGLWENMHHKLSSDVLNGESCIKWTVKAPHLFLVRGLTSLVSNIRNKLCIRILVCILEAWRRDLSFTVRFLPGQQGQDWQMQLSLESWEAINFV
jgi:hypothetical protein